jgi:hypothetical protein
MKNMPVDEIQKKYLKLRNNLISLVYLNILVFDIFCILYMLFY